ncbi:MAG: sulfatase-like hydrolase/transferase [Planctomycetota bacterium]
MRRRNLIIYLARGLRADAMGAAGAWPLTTDHLERLASRGVWASAVSASTHDEPARRSVLTGLSPRQHGRRSALAAQEPAGRLSDSWAHRLAEAGYHVAGVGCVEPIAGAMSESEVVADTHLVRPEGCAYYAACRASGVLAAIMAQRKQACRAGLMEPDRLMLSPTDDVDGWIARRAASMVERMPEDRPWALVVGFSGPGNALPPPTLYEGIVPTEELVAGAGALDHGELRATGSPTVPRSVLERMTPARTARARADYLGRVSLIDYAVKRIDERAGERPDASRAWSVFAGDRGYALGEQGVIGDGVLMSGVVRTTVIVAGPRGFRPAEGSAESAGDGMVTSSDVAATIADLSVTDEVAGASGRSLVGALRGQAMASRRAVVCEGVDRLAVDTGRHRLIVRRESGEALALYDLHNDGEQRVNLLGEDAPAAQRRWATAMIEPIKSRLADVLVAESARVDAAAPAGLTSSTAC